MNENSNITCIILTKNESKNLANCLGSIQNLAKRVVVVDSGSTDGTKEIALKFGAEVLSHDFENYGIQFNWAIDNCHISTKWVYRIDADEVVTPELGNEILTECGKHDNDDVSGMLMKFQLFFLGKKLKHGGAYPFYNLTIFKSGKGRYTERMMGEHVIISDGKTITLKNICEHHDFKDLSTWISKHNWYSTREVIDFYATKNERTTEDVYRHAKRASKLRLHFYYKLPMFFRAHLYFFFNYYLRLGFLDGRPGRIYCWLQSYWYRFLVDAKIYECEINGSVYDGPGSLTK